MESSQPWRVVVITNLPHGLVYRAVDAVVRPMGHKVVGVITTPGPKRRRSDAYLDVVAAISPGVDVIVSNHPERWAQMAAVWKPDLIVCGGMPWKLPLDLIELPTRGAINMHPSLLPKHRGPLSVEWAFRNGDPEIGFSVHYLAERFDTGPILSQTTTPISDDDNLATLMEKLGPIVPAMLAEAIGRVAAGDPGMPQDESLASEAPFFEPEWRFIDWTATARTVHNQVRSWSGLRDIPHGALGMVEGVELQITRTRLIHGAADSTSRPGSVLGRDDGAITVQCGDGPIALIEWKETSEDETNQ